MSKGIILIILFSVTIIGQTFLAIHSKSRKDSCDSSVKEATQTAKDYQAVALQCLDTLKKLVPLKK